MTEDILKTILAALPGVEAAQVAFGRDSTTSKPTAKVSLRADQLELVLREDGRYVREAAKATGVAINVSLAR